MSELDYTTRQLTADDWEQWKEIRLESLVDCPAAFGASFEEESIREDSFFKNTMVNTAVWGGFINGKLVSVVGFCTQAGERYKHRGKIFGVYTTPAARGKGICKKLMQISIEYAKNKVSWLAIHVWTENPVAYKMYSSLGFVTYCTELKCLRVSDTEIVDYHLMRIDF